MQKVYGLTGGIGSGKSAFARSLERHGAVIIDADQVAREVVEPGTPGLAAIVEAFGEGVLTPGGQLDREALGRIVFKDADRRQKLNAIIHPLIGEASGKHIVRAAMGTQGPVFYEAALLVENDAYEQFAGLVVVAASPEIQIQRIMARDGINEDEARERLASQLPMEEKVARADWVIWNEGSLAELDEKAVKLLEELRRPEEG